MYDFVGNILQNKFYACCYIFLSGTGECTPICGAAILLKYNETSLLLAALNSLHPIHAAYS